MAAKMLWSDKMGIPKIGRSKNKQLMHYSVGAVIKKNGKYLLIERRFIPYGFAGIAGHVDVGESEKHAIVREVREESGLKVIEYSLLFDEDIYPNKCVVGIKVHHWYLFECKTTGKIKKNVIETRKIGWYSVDEIKKLKLEPVWKHWFKKMKVI